uniref:Striated muscle enriched protein kinase b n=1 Tax=Erpetoichthys calabaricus TaxID=27687 RepID=A0A8C4T2A9_ERPCA
KKKTNKKKKNVRSCNQDAKETAPVFIRKMKNAAVGTGCDIRLKVGVAGDPQPTLTWYRNESRIPTEKQEYGGLWIKDCKLSDAGLYTCIATNPLGEARTSAVLAVMDLGEDSETTEDEAADPQIPIESKEGGARHPQDKAAGNLITPIEYQDTVPGEFEEKIKQPKSSALSQTSTQDSRPQTPLSEYSRKDLTLRPSPKLTRASSKIFEKVRYFEERRRSIDQPEGSISGRSWAGFHRARSFEQSDDERSRTGISRESSREDLREALRAEAAQRRSMFKQKASSFDDRPRYTHKIQDIENKFTEELQRIKKVVGKPQLGKSFSTDQIAHRSGRTPLKKLEPIPPQVIKKLQDRERIQQQQQQEQPQQQQQQQQITQQPLNIRKPLVRSIATGDLSSENDGLVDTGEDLLEAPLFEVPLRDMEAESDTEVLLKCIITGNPLPEEPSLAVIRQVRDVTVKAGETALFECLITGPPDVDVDWLSNGKLIQPALLNCKMHFDGKRCKLLLNSVHEDDSGSYTCKLSTAKDELTSSGNLKVIPSIEPLFTRKLDILEVIEGRTARFDCKVSGTPPPQVTWSHFEQTLEENENIRILKDHGLHSLIISHVSNENEGFYTVIAKNAHGEAECSAELYVQEPRPAVSSQIAKLEKMPSIPEEPEVPESEVERFTMPDFVRPLQDLDVVEGKEAILKCKVAGLPYPTITWFHNGQKIDSTEDRKMMQYRDIHSLVIRSVTHAHGGVYKSVISNKVGKATCYAHLYVTDVLPDPPDGAPVVEAITGKTMTLRWKKPKKLDPTLDPNTLTYIIQCQTVGMNQWTLLEANVKTTMYTVHSLSKGVLYIFRVLSATAKSHSKPSPPTEPVQLIDRGPYLEEAPVIIDKPDVVYVVENQPVCITVTLNHVHAGVIWKKNDSILVNKPNLYEMCMPDDDQHTLKIMQIGRSDVGEIVCIASNQYGSDTCTLSLNMAEPPSFESIMEDIDVSTGETSRFAVVVEGKPIPDILWHKNDTLLSESSHFTFVYDDNECSLVVLNTTEEDSGVYTCTAKNLAGSVYCKAELTVHAEKEEEIEDEETLLRKMRRLTDFYDVHKEIGRGAFSYVKLVTERSGKVEYAAKFIPLRAKSKASALKELNILSQLDHERIVYFHDAFEKKNGVIIITEVCHEEFLEKITKKTSVLESEIRSFMRQILEGISYLHQNNILHLDIKPENILMADSTSEQIRICDFGNAKEVTPEDAQYCKYGTPEFVAPEIVNQTPVSKATDIWYVFVLTGVSPFVGENDRATVLNIRNYNVAFEEKMFEDLCREAKGFVIKLLVSDRLRPDANECLRHPWFKVSLVRSLINYKSKMVMRSIPDLLDDSSTHVSIAVPKHLKEGSPPPSSSSDSEDIDELPFIPMPLTMEFSSSRMSLNEIPADDEMVGHEDNQSSDEDSSERPDHAKRPLRKGSSVESDKGEGSSKRGELRRGSSADSALLLHIKAEEGTTDGQTEEPKKGLKKALSMELPRRSPSPGTLDERRKLSHEDYALKLELMRQRLLRGGSVDKKMSGLREPLLETLRLAEDDPQKRSTSLERYTRPPRGSPVPPLARAASSDTPREVSLDPKVLRKSASFSQGDTEPIPLHRRLGAPLEIPLTQIEGKQLQECVSMSALTEQTKLDSRPSTPREISSKPPTPDREEIEGKVSQKHLIRSVIAPCAEPSYDEKLQMAKLPPEIIITKSSTVVPLEINIKVASNEQTRKEPSPPKTPPPPALSQPTSDQEPKHIIEDLASEEVFEAKFKRRESSLTRGLKLLTRSKSEEKSLILPPSSGEEIYRPGPIGAPLEFVKPEEPKKLEERAKSVQDLREAEKDTSFMRRLSLRLKGTPSTERKEVKSGEESPALEHSAPKRRLSWTLGRSSFRDKKEKEVEMVRMEPGAEKQSSQEVEIKESRKPNESPVLTMRKKIESTVAGISMRIRSHSEERKEEKKGEKETKQEKRTPLLSLLRRSNSEGTNLKRLGVPSNQLASQSHAAPSTESLQSESSVQSEAAVKAASESDRRSRWDRWGLTRSKREKGSSQPNIPSAIARENDFPPVFHIKLRDHVLLEGDPITLCCLPAGSPTPHIEWLKDKKPVELDSRISIVSCPDGRQLLMIMKACKKDAGLYECVAKNPLASVTSSCLLSLARLPSRPGTPEIPQRYKNTALVLWKPSDSRTPCTYTLERKTEGDSDWLTVATGVADCYYNSTELPMGSTLKFRVACVNKAGQGPYSNSSEKVQLDSLVTPPSPVSTAVSTSPTIKTTLTLTVTTPSLVAQPTTSPEPLPRLPPPSPPPPVLPKPTTPVSLVTPISPVTAVTPLPLPSPSGVIGKPISSVPMYVPATLVQTPPTQVSSLTPPVVLVTSLSPVGEGPSTPSRITPTGRVTPSAKSVDSSTTALRQGVPQKPYTFMDERARGRYGVIRECKENATGKQFMAKIIPYEAESKQSVLQEYEILKSLRHEKVMALHEAYVTPRYLVLISESCVGKELLYSLIDRFRYSEDDVVGYIVQILQGLEYLHNRRILHLDVKPDNIIVTYMNVVKIIDFGSAQTFNPLFLKQLSQRVGTLEFMSPEVIKGDVVGPPADIWGIGVLTYIMLSGRSPFLETNPLETENRIQIAKFDLTKLYPNVSQSASLFLKKILCSYPWARPTIKDCFANSWLQDAYLMKLRRQTLTFTTSRLKEFLVEYQRRRAEIATKHKVLLRSYQGTQQAPVTQ